MNAVISTLDGPVARLTLNRSETRNAIDLATAGRLLDCLSAADSDPAARCILLDATGPVFCSGLEEPETLNFSTGAAASTLDRLASFGTRCSKPIVAAVQGAALGFGITLAAAAHIALASQGTSFGLVEIRKGSWPFAGWEAIRNAIGGRRALELSLTGRIFSAQEALQWGLIHEITQPSELEDRAWAIASLLAKSPEQIVRAALARCFSIANPGRIGGEGT